MKLPQINQSQDQVTMINAFMGVNKNLSIQDAEWSDMKNMTNDYYPVLGNRKKRGLVKTLTNPQALIGGKTWALIDNNKLFYDDTEVTGVSLQTVTQERIMVMMGAQICIFPDGIIYNTVSHEVTNMKNEVTKSGITLSICKADGTGYASGSVVYSNTAPSDTSKYWVDISKDDPVMKMYDSNTSQWTSVGTTYVKMSGTGTWANGFKDYDAVTMSGIDTGIGYNGYDFNQANIVFKKGNDSGGDFLVIAGLLNSASHTNSANITFKRDLPQMDYVCELNNRLWGCSSDNNEIYACKLGDPTNWNCYAGLDDDSYAVSVGTQNVFTGAIAYQGSVYFFKEDGYHRIYGTKPSNFQAQWKPGRGVQFGSEKSLCIVNEYLFFKARDGICMYDGSVSNISEALGSDPYYEAVAGGYRNKYYVSMRDVNYKYNLYVYDTTKGTWIIEDDVKYKFFAYANFGLYTIDYYNKMRVVNSEEIYVKWFPESTVYPSSQLIPGNSKSANLEDNVDWSVTSGDIGMNSPYHKYIKRFDMRLSLETNAKLRIEVSYDCSNAWENVMDFYCTRKRSYSIPIPVKRCDTMKIRLSGKGDIRLYSIAKIVEDGADGHI